MTSDKTIGKVIGVLITILGCVAVLTPLALWLAWSATVFYLVLVIGCSAILAITVLAHFAPD